MKIKVAIASLAVATVVVAAFAFAPAKKLNPVTFYYKVNAADQRIETGFTTPGVEHSLTTSSYTNVNNWSTTDQGASDYTSADGSSYLKSFTIEDFEAVSDGDDDGQISLQEALTAINAQHISMGSYPSTSATVTVNANNSGGSAMLSGFTRAEDANIP